MFYINIFNILSTRVVVAKMSQATRDSIGILTKVSYIILCTSKSGFNVPNSQFTNQVPAISQTTVAVVVAVLKVLVLVLVLVLADLKKQLHLISSIVPVF